MPEPQGMSPAQQQATVVPQEKQQRSRSAPTRPVVPQITSDDAAAAGRSAAGLMKNPNGLAPGESSAIFAMWSAKTDGQSGQNSVLPALMRLRFPELLRTSFHEC
jgi:hypothetical protein